MPPPQPQPCQGCGELTLCQGWETRSYYQWLFDLSPCFHLGFYIAGCKARICPDCMETACRLFDMGRRARQIAGRNHELCEHLDRLEYWHQQTRARASRARDVYEQWAPRLGLSAATMEDLAEVIRDSRARWVPLSRYAFLDRPKPVETPPDDWRWVMIETGERAGLARCLGGQWTDAAGHWIRTPRVWWWWEVERFAHAARRGIRWKIGAHVQEPAEEPER